MSVVIDGKKLAAEREERLREKVARFVSEFHRKPTLLAVEISDDPGSALYLKLKKSAAERIGIEFEVVKRSDLAVQQGLTLMHTDGIFIQHPPHYDKQQWQELVDQIPPEKDVDCLTTENLHLIKQGKPRFLPATVKAVCYCLDNMFLISSSRATPPTAGESRDLATGDKDISIASLDSSTPLRSARNDSLLRHFLKNKKIVVLGRSPILGLPLSWWLERLGGDVTVLHSQSTISNQQLAIRQADILISSVGKPGLVTSDMVKSGVIVIDCGSPSGDVAFSEVAPKASAITPVPGGVGPLTVVSLMENVVEAAMLQYPHHTGRECS